MEKKKKLLEAPPIEQVEKAPKAIVLDLLARVQEENNALDDLMGTFIGDREKTKL